MPGSAAPPPPPPPPITLALVNPSGSTGSGGSRRSGTPVPRYEAAHDDSDARSLTQGTSGLVSTLRNLGVPGSEMSPNAVVFLERIPRDSALAQELARNLVTTMSQMTTSTGVYFPMEFTQRTLEDL